MQRLRFACDLGRYNCIVLYCTYSSRIVPHRRASLPCLPRPWVAADGQVTRKVSDMTILHAAWRENVASWWVSVCSSINRRCRELSVSSKNSQELDQHRADSSSGEMPVSWNDSVHGQCGPSLSEAVKPWSQVRYIIIRPVGWTRKPPVEAVLAVTYLQFPIQVCFPCSASSSPTLLPSPTLVVLIIV